MNAQRRLSAAAIKIGLAITLGILLSALNASSSRAAAARPQSRSTLSLNVWGGDQPVRGYRLTPREAISAAQSDPRAQRALRGQVGLRAGAFPIAGHQWIVVWIAHCDARCLSTRKMQRLSDERATAYVDDLTGRTTQVWTGLQAQVDMARGGAAYVGRLLNKIYVWIPLCLLFLLPFVDRRRPFRLLHLDLLAMLGFSASQAFFARGDIPTSVPLVYPVLAYLLFRMVIAGLRPRHRTGSLVPHASRRWLIAGIALLTVFHVALNLVDSNVLDVGAAGVGGADQIIHHRPLYGGQLGIEIQGGDTYGPVNYLAYLPFRLLAPGTLYGSETAHLAAICFDLLTLLGLVLLGRRLRKGEEGITLGLALGYAWMAFPYTAFALAENTNDSLVAALLVFTVLVLSSPVRRGIMLGLAAMVKFFPLALVPLLASGRHGPNRRDIPLFAVALLATCVVCVLPLVPPSALHHFYDLTLGGQLSRQSPLSLWGQAPGLSLFRKALEAATVAGAVALCIRPRPRSDGQVAALAAAVILAIQVCLAYWYYPYVVWFAPLVLVTLFGEHRTSSAKQGLTAQGGQTVPAVSAPVPELVA